MKVSVIIPTYNRSHLISEAIASVLKQTQQNLEIIVVDDGSTDETVKTVTSYGKSVKLISQNHLGPNTARNRALAAAEGEYIALLDDDDLWVDFKLEIQVALMNHFPDVGFIFSDFIILKESGERINAGLNTWHTFPKRWDKVFEKKLQFSSLNLPIGSEIKDFNFYLGSIYYESLFEPYVLPSSAIIRKSFIHDDIKFVEDDYHCGDWDFFARFSRSHPVCFMELETTINRSHEDSVRLTRKSRRVQTECRLGMINRLWKKDEEFALKHQKEIAAVEGEQLVVLAKQLLLENKHKEAKKVLQQWKSLGLTGRNSLVLVLRFIASIPGCLMTLHLFLGLRKILHPSGFRR